MKNFSFDGRLGKDAEVLATKGGKPYVRFSVANNSFNGGTEKTEWIDVTSYDQYVVENRVKYLTKGTYVIINGDVRFDVAIKEGKVWKNIYVTANSIDTPNFGKRDDSQDEQTAEQGQAVANGAEASQDNEQPVSTYTEQPAAQQPAPAFVASTQANVQGESDDDLPF